MSVPGGRKFGGKQYIRHGFYGKKSKAKKVQADLKKKGLYVRVVRVKGQTIRKRRGLMYVPPGWDVFVRKKAKSKKVRR